MKVLVIDDDPTTQKVMEMFLRKSGYTPLLHSDALKGLEAALAPDAPMILVLDWMMPGLDGPVLCKKLREAKLTRRPYVIFLSGRNKKEEVAAGLDAGADDFVTKPFNILEMQARLRVARRNVEHQLELLRMADELSVLKSRNDLLGELMSGHAPASSPPVAAAPIQSRPLAATDAKTSPAGSAADEVKSTEATGEAPAPVATAEAKSTEPEISDSFMLSGQEIRYVLSSALMETRLALQAATVTPHEVPVCEGDCCAWGSVLAGPKQVWIDVLFATKLDAALVLFETALRRKPRSNDELVAFFAEVARVVSRRMTQMFTGAGAVVSQPLSSFARVLGADASLPPLPSARQVFILKIEGVAARLLIVRQYCASKRLEVEALREGDVLAEPFPRREVSEVPIFNEGVALTPRFLDKLNFHMEKTQVGGDVLAFRPSALANFFLRR